MVTRGGPNEPTLITIPASDAAFREHVRGLGRAAGPTALETRLRRIFPRVVVRQRIIAGAPAWYVYRDGAWSSSLLGDWWDDPGLPRVVVSSGGWVTEASATAQGILGIDHGDIGSVHVSDFAVPGTLEDTAGLFRIVEEGSVLDATVLLRPTTGDVIAIDLHAQPVDGHVVGVFRLAEDVEVAADVIGARSAGPTEVEYVPPIDVAFRGYVQRALARMAEPTPDGLALRVRRLYPHATVEADGARWIARRDRDTAAAAPDWWLEQDVASVRYDAQALILEANDAAESLFGRSLVGHHWQEFVTPGSTEQVSVMIEILAEAGAAESRFRMPRGDGTLLEFDSYTEVRGEELVTWFRPSEAGPSR